jgi:hypothetical protein
MDIGTVIADLRREAERISRAIAALTGLGTTRTIRKRKVGASRGTTSKAKKRGGMTPAGRKRLSMLMKKRWAERRAKKTSTKAAAAAKQGNRKKRRGGLTPAGRKKLSEAMKMRWAERKKQAS